MTAPRLAATTAGFYACFIVLVSTCATGVSSAQQAYFSFEGDFPTNAGDQYDFTFNLAADQAGTPGMFFRTYSGEGGTNLAGDTIADGPIDPVLELFNGGGLLTSDDDSFGLDSQIDFTNATDGGALPDPLPAGDYRLNHRTFGNDDAGPWALDLAGPAGNFTLTGASPVNGSTATSLKLGTIDTGMGTDAATFNQTGTLNLTGALVVAQTGNALLQNLGTTTVAGPTTVNAGGTLSISGQLNANGNVAVDGGTVNTFTNTTALNLAPGGTLIATNDAQINFNGPRYTLGSGRTFSIQSGSDFTTANGLDLGNGNTGTLIVEGDGSSLDVNIGSVFAAFAGGTAEITIRDQATAAFDNEIFLATFGNNATGTINAESGAALTAHNNLRIAADTFGPTTGSTATVNVTGTGSTLTQTGSAALTVGGTGTSTGTVNVTNNAAFTTAAATTLIAETGTLNLNSGGVFNANGNVNVVGGTINSTEASGNTNSFQLAGNTLNASANAQLVFTGDYDVDGGATFNLTDGADWSLTQDLDIGNTTQGTVVLDGPGTTLTSNGATASVGFGDFDGVGVGVLTLRNDASATFGGLFQAGAGGGTGTVTVESGADLTLTGGLNVAAEDMNTGTLTVTGTGSTITLNGSGPIKVGNNDTASTDSGTLTIADGAIFTTAATTTTTVHATGTVNLDTTVTPTSAIDAQLILNGDLVVQAGGLVTSDAASIEAGTTPGATFTNRGTFRPRSVSAQDVGTGQSTISGSVVAVPYVQEADGTFEIGPAAGEGFLIPSLSTLFLNADYTLAGELSLIADRTGDPLTDLGFMATYDFPEQLITHFGPTPTRTGVFDTVTGHVFTDGTALAVLYDGAFVNAQRVLYGDGDLSGQIEQADLDAVLQNWGKSNLNGNTDQVSWVTGDYNGSGQVEQGDLDAVLQNWGSTASPDFSLNPAVVPEPTLAAALALLALTRPRLRER